MKKIRAIRNRSGMIIGLVGGVISLLWLYFLDVTVNASVYWVWAAVCALCASLSLIVGAYISSNGESKKWIIFDIISTICQVGFLITLFVMNDNAKLISKTASVGLYMPLYYVVLIVSIVIGISIIAIDAFDIYGNFIVKETEEPLVKE